MWWPHTGYSFYFCLIYKHFDHKCLTPFCIQCCLPREQLSHLASLMSTQQLSFLLSDLTASTTTFSDISDLINRLNNACSPILHRVRLWKVRLVQVTNSSPWISDHIRHQRRAFRKSECKWKKTHLHVNYLLMMEVLVTNSSSKDTYTGVFLKMEIFSFCLVF